ncbi:hypothetical protein [Azospirillum sp. INR13]|uniref:hypothetical protein n=1 Tax=Azospirillum sp. INR13 TaxID=2596919 RepID=UPI002106CC35|nr:hypothetical protein [Azospirillum sp. INR13]
MRLKASPPTPLLTAILLMLVPLLGVLAWAVHVGALHGGLALVAAALALAGAVLVLRTYRRDADAMTDYAARAGGGRRAAGPYRNAPRPEGVDRDHRPAAPGRPAPGGKRADAAGRG